jgi:hypothetical protein
MTDLVGGDCGVFESSSLAAVAGYPNITVPAGYIQGLPAASHSSASISEPLLIKIAYAFEQATKARKTQSSCRHTRNSHRIFTALAANSASTVSEITDWTIIRTLAQRSRMGTSVGEKAVLVLKARKSSRRSLVTSPTARLSFWSQAGGSICGKRNAP